MARLFGGRRGMNQNNSDQPQELVTYKQAKESLTQLQKSLLSRLTDQGILPFEREYRDVVADVRAIDAFMSRKVEQIKALESRIAHIHASLSEFMSTNFNKNA